MSLLAITLISLFTSQVIAFGGVHIVVRQIVIAYHHHDDREFYVSLFRLGVLAVLSYGSMYYFLSEQWVRLSCITGIIVLVMLVSLVILWLLDGGDTL